ncbi:hypothetical protein [Streptomyces sp. ME19-01-6]|uniref:hypothetical protein n=1 Tax=Streptomyces sp. ME19-01-6 TaxID=3028686 RepID=UPI0029C9F1C3|nr:hypothetical protein [Streptomyces sp. ME19-01-6]
MSSTRRALGTGPRLGEPESSPDGDGRERARTVAERAALEPPVPFLEDQLEARPPGRRQLGTGPERDDAL